MTVAKLLNSTTETLRSCHIISASLDAEILLSFVLKKSKEFLYANPDYHLTKNQLLKFQTLISRRATCEPIAYLTGHKEFYGLDFIIDKNVLIPRPETELMVDEVLALIKKNPANKYTVIDIGTGSGCVLISVAKNLPQISNIKYYGLDISKPAITVAKRNARLNGVSQKIKFLPSDLLTPALKYLDVKMFKCLNTKMIITANLPYLTQKQYRANPSLHYEPKNALVAGPDGLKYYRALVQQTKTLSRLTHYSLPITLFLEIDPSQATPLKKVIHSYFPSAPILVQKDLAGLNRLIIVKLT